MIGQEFHDARQRVLGAVGALYTLVMPEPNRAANTIMRRTIHGETKAVYDADGALGLVSIKELITGP